MLDSEPSQDRRLALRLVESRGLVTPQDRAIVEQRFKIGDDVGRDRRRSSKAKQLKQRTGRSGKESTSARSR